MNYAENKINNLQDEKEIMKEFYKEKIMALESQISDLKKYNGISLRDHFAGLAMQSYVNKYPDQTTIRLAYLLADAMLIERDKIHA